MPAGRVRRLTLPPGPCSPRSAGGSSACFASARRRRESSALSLAAKRRLYAYQKEGVRRFLAEGRLVLADDMGLGKTTQAIVASSALFDAGLVQRGLFVVPASLKPQWEREWLAASDAPLQDRRRRRRGEAPHLPGVRSGFLVTNYEQVVRDFEDIVRWAPDLVVLDEAQRIKTGRPRLRSLSSG